MLAHIGWKSVRKFIFQINFLTEDHVSSLLIVSPELSIRIKVKVIHFISTDSFDAIM